MGRTARRTCYQPLATSWSTAPKGSKNGAWALLDSEARAAWTDSANQIAQIELAAIGTLLVEDGFRFQGRKARFFIDNSCTVRRNQRGVRLG